MLGPARGLGFRVLIVRVMGGLGILLDLEFQGFRVLGLGAGAAGFGVLRVFGFGGLGFKGFQVLGLLGLGRYTVGL